MAKKSHDRSPDKKGFSIALPIALIADLERISKAETRSRNGQIERLLQESVRLWKESMAEKQAKPVPMIVGMDAPKPAKNAIAK